MKFESVFAKLPALAATVFCVATVSAAPVLRQVASTAHGDLDRPYCTATFPSNNLAGSLIVVAVQIGATAEFPHPLVVHDTQGNTYYPASSHLTWRASGGGSSAQLFYAPNVRPGPNTVTMTEPNVGGTGAGNAFNLIAVHEYTGISIASPLDVSVGAIGTTTNAPFVMRSGAATTATDGELIFGYGNTLGAVLSAGAGFSSRVTNAGTSEDMVQTLAGPVEATLTNGVSDNPYVMFMASFVPSLGSTSGPVLPFQANRTANALALLTVTNTAAQLNTNLLATNTMLFNYTNRAALLADGWSYIATNGGVGRNTEITNSANGGVVSYDQSAHPGALRIPCDEGTLIGSANNSRNTLFRNLSSNWVSARLSLNFTPTNNYQQATLILYQDDNNYVEVEFGFNSDLNSGQIVRVLREVNGQAPSFVFTDTIWYKEGPGSPLTTNITVRLDRSLETGVISAFSTFDGTNWPFVGSFSQNLVNPRLGIRVGGSQVPYTNTLPNCDVKQLDVLTTTPWPALGYSLSSAPSGVGISSNGIITWTPTLGQSPSTNTITTIATNTQFPSLSATNSFEVIVYPPPTNTVPVLPGQTNRSVNELTQLVVTNTATDTDIPAQLLTYSLLSPPSGAVISTNGIITWTPGQTQSPGTNTLTTIVTDNGAPTLSATNSFQVFVIEVNQAPVLPAQTNRTLLGAQSLTVTNTASQPNIHSVSDGYALLSSPAGADISTNGIITWSPGEAQIPSTNLFTTVTTNFNPYDAVNPRLTATNSFTVFVLPEPLPPGPILPTQTNQTVVELSTMVVTNTAAHNGTIPGLATNVVSFNYTNAAALASDGWSFIALRANGTERNTENSLVPVDYNQTNHPGILRVPCDVGDMWGTDNSSRNSLFHTLPADWSSMRLEVGFNPSQNYHQVHLGIYQDDDNYVHMGLGYNGGQGLSMIRETGANPAYSLAAVSGVTNIFLRMDQNVTNGNITGSYSLNGDDWLTISNYTHSLTNARLGIWTGSAALPYTSNSPVADFKQITLVVPTNVPAVLNYSLLNPPDGAQISSNGVITWTPNTTQGPGLYDIITVVSDGLYDATNSFAVYVIETNTSPTATNFVVTIFEDSPTNLTLLGSDAEGPVTFAVLLSPTNGALSGFDTNSGAITYTPNANFFGPDAFTYRVADGSLFATGAVSITVLSVNDAPTVANAVTNQVGAYSASFSFTFPSDTFADIDTGGLTYTANGMPPGIGFDGPTRTFSGTPTETGDYEVRLIATDDSAPPLSATNIFNLSIAKAVLTITATDTNKVYGTSLTPVNYSVSGLLNSDSVTNVTLTSSGSVSNAPVGSYAIVPSLAQGVGLTNYTIGYGNGTLTVNAAGLLITASDTNKVYGTSLAPVDYTVSGLLNEDSVTNVTLSSSGSLSNASVGSYAIIASNALGTGLTNYTIGYGNGTLTVNAAGLLITATDTNKVYGTSLTPVNYSVSGLLNEDSVTNVTLSSSGSVSNAAVGSYAIVPSLAVGTGLTNYTIGYGNGTLTVNAAGLLITASDTNKVYGTSLTFAGTEFIATGLLNIDTVTSVSLTSAGALADAVAGTYAIVATNANGTGLSNYAISYVNGTLTVTNSDTLFLITSIVPLDGSAVITWNSVSNQTYVLQYKDVLSNPVWSEVPATIPSGGLSTTVTNALGGAQQRFYRVRLGAYVAPAPAPQITSIVPNGGEVVVTWTSVSGYSYRLQYKDDLTTANWTAILPDIPAVGATCSGTNLVTGVNQRFYRVVRLSN